MLGAMARGDGDAQEGRTARGRAGAGRGASRKVVRRRQGLALTGVLALAVGGWLLSAAGGGSAPHPARSSKTLSAQVARTASRTLRQAPRGPHVAVSPTPTTAATWTTVARVYGQPAAWLRLTNGVALLRFDQRYVHLTLHAGSLDGGIKGWTYGDQITPREIHLVVAAFNGGFKLTYANVGFVSSGQAAAPLKRGLASIVTYTDGTTAIGAWGNGVPTARKTVFSVLQNQFLLIDRGVAASTVSSCVIACWGATIRGLTVVARSALGITADGQLVWAGGENLSPATLAAALISAGAVRAVELDINPDWVAGYLYVHHATGPVASPVIPGQLGIAGQLLAPYTRDFMAIVAN